LSALDLARVVRDGSVSSAEVVSFYLDRIERANPRLQAFVSVFRSRALKAAHRKDRLRKEPGLPPFHGVPVGVKDLNLARASFARMGSRAWRWLWSPVDDLTVAALRRAGFVLVGKLSTSELALMPVVEPDLHPPTRNPWNPDYSAGGSSGGSGAAVAGGLLPIAQGSDGGGSIRIPAAFCHLVGFKPSRDRIPNPHLGVDRLRASAIGPLARSVEDAAAFLDALAGRDPLGSDSWLSVSRRPVKRMRVVMVTESPMGKTEPELVAAVRRVAEGLVGLGHRVEERAVLRITYEEFLPVYQRMAANAPVLLESKLQPISRWLRAEGRRHPRDEISERFAQIASRIIEWFGDDVDVMLTPTTPVSPPRVGAWNGMPPGEAFRCAAPIAAFTVGLNITGQPGVSLPAGFTAAGLPVGVQIIGRRGADETVLALAREMEAAKIVGGPAVAPG
jgi:amidase